VFELVTETLLAGRCQRHVLFDGVEHVSYQSILDLWQHSDDFRHWYTGVLKSCPYDAFRWESPPISNETLGRPFEFVLVDAPEINIAADLSPFQEHFSATEGEGIVSFENLGGDALMVVPTPLAEDSSYSHFAAFIRNAPAEQIDELWRRVGEAVSKRLSDQPLWLSTAGGGVAWLHVRLDSRPKYYAYEPYKVAADF
jgi:hypothetical protein